MTTPNEERHVNLAELFEQRFKTAQKEISQLLAKDARDRYDGEQPIVFFMRFYPLSAMLVVYALTIIAAILAGWYSNRQGLDKSTISFYAAWLALVLQILILSIVWTSSRATRHQSATGRWLRIAEHMIAQYKDPKDIAKGAKISIYFHEQTLAFFLALVSVLTLYSNLESRVLKTDIPWGSRLLRSLGFPETYFTVIFTTVFFLAMITVFFGVYAPLSWRKHLQVLVEQNIEEKNKS